MKTASKPQKTLVLLDSHALIHRAYHALPDFATASGEPTGALYGLSTTIIKILSDFEPDYIVACYDRKEKTHRHEVYTDYKGTRKELDSDLIKQLNTSREIFEGLNIPIYDKAGFEADDMLGTIVEQLKDDKSIRIIIASGDMDTLQLVSGTKVQVFTMKKGIKETVLYDEDGVRARFGFSPDLIPDFKGLRGDPSDNIPGIAGIGEKTATTLITTFGSLEDMYKVLDKSDAKFREIKITERIIGLLKEGKEEAMFSKMLATIRRDAPITFELPDKTFKDGLDEEQAEKTFRKFEFKSLALKLKEVVGGKNSKNTPSRDHELEYAESESTVGDDNQEDVVLLSVAEKLLVSCLDSNITNPTLEDAFRLSGADTKDQAIDLLKKRLTKENLDKIYQIEMELEPVLRRMEHVGVKIDEQYLKQLSKTYHEKLVELEKEIFEAAGGEFKINSPKQLGEVLFDKLGLTAKGMKKTAGGARSTKESELLKLADTHPIVAHILNYRELQKLVSTYIDTIPLLLDDNKRLHTTFNQIGAATGRMSSNNPNLQNIPIKSESGRAIRNAFIAEKGFEFVSFDYSQIELRIAAFLSNDEKLMKIFKDGIDVHTAVSSQVFNVPIDEVTSDMRRKAKVINFGILYGMGITALRANLHSTKEEAETFYNEYFKTYPKLAAWLEEVKKDAAKNGYTTTLLGRRRYFPDIKSKLPYLRASAERMAMNAPIQGTQADLIKIAMINIDAYIKKEKLEEKVRLLIQVHDELDCEIHESVAEQVIPKIKSIMEKVLTSEESKGVPIIANGSAGKSWGELKKVV
jgi:DNA polymerase-1